MFVRPRQTAPPARSRSMVKASRCATSSANAGLPGGSGQPAHEVAVLGRVRDAVERAERPPLASTKVGCRGIGERAGIAHDQCVERGGRRRAVIRVDAKEVGVDQVDGGRRARFECGAQLGDGCLDDVDHRATAGCCWVMQWMPPPRAKIGRASTVTTRRPGYASARIARAAASARSSPNPHAITPPLTTVWLT